MSDIEALLRAVDSRWRPIEPERRVTLKLIGQTALYLQCDYERGTKDGDVLETDELTKPIQDQLRNLAGRGSRMAIQHGMYIDVVACSIPLLPAVPTWHHYPMRLRHFDVQVLDAADVLVSKLIRYSGPDRDDVRAMVDGGHVEHGRLRARFELVVARYMFDGRADLLPTMVDRFHEIERDLFGVDESTIDLHPSVYQ